MNPIFQALVGGYSATQIINFISQAFPKFKPQINKAQKMGYSADKIVEFLSDTMQSDANSQYETSSKITNRKRAENKELTKDILKTGLAAGATAIGYQFLQKAAPAIARQFLGQVAQPSTGPQSSLPPTPPSPPPRPPPPPPAPPNMQNSQATNPAAAVGAPQILISPLPQQSPINPSPAPQVGPNVQSQAQAPVNAAKQSGQVIPQAAPQPQAPQANIGQLFQQSGLMDKVEALRAKNAPDVIAKILRAQSGAQVKEIEQATQAPFEQIVNDYVANAPPVETMQEKIAKGVPLPEERREMEKGKTVALPTGEIGEITDIRQGIATVNANGREHRRKVDDLIEEPRDIAEQVQELLKIPEIDRSSIVSLFTFDPEEKKMYIQFHNGESYKYLDVDPEKVFKVANKMGIPVTQGKNIYGAWSPQDKKSLGAALIKEIINDPKYKKSKKGEPQNPNYVKLETLYDYWEKLRKKRK